MTAPSPRRRNTLGLAERHMNRFNEDDTLQLSAPARKRKSLSELTLTSWDLLSEEQKERRRMVRHIIYQADSQRPRKSILKTDAYEPEDTTSMSAINASMSTSARGAARKSVGISRRVSFAPSAHVRMGTLPSDKERRRKSVGSRRGSLAAPGSVAAAARRSSIQVMQSNPISPRAARPAQTQPRSPLQRYFVGEGEDQGEESMEMSEDESDMEIEVSLEPSALQASADESYGTDEEMDMEETAVLGAPWPAASQEEEDEDEEMDMTVSDVTFSGDEEKTMDFTVALGSGLPNVPPQDARHNRRSIGYLNPGAGEEEPLRPGDDTESSMMMETAVYGTGVGVVYADDSLSSADEAGHSDPERHTMTFNYGGGDMEFTSVVGGVGPDESGMELTVAVGGIHGVPDDGTVMQFTTVVGGIHDGAAGGDTTAMEFTMAVGGIHQPATTTMTTNIFDTTTTRRNIFAPDDYLAGHTATQAGLVFPVMEPARITAIDDSVSPGADAASASGSGEPTPAPPTRVRGSSATPARKTPTATPGFMRPTAASAKKEKAGKTPAAAPATATTTTTGKKKNPFAPSPDSPGLQRSKSRTPGSGATSAATSVAQRLFTPGTPSAAANVFSTTPRKATTGMPKAATPKAATPKAATPKAATPKSAAKSTKITPRKKTPSKTPGAAPSSATPKRPRGEDTQTTGKKRNIFAPDSTNRSRTLGQPEVAEDAVDDMLIEEDASPEPAPAPAPARPTSSYTPIRNRPSLAARASLAPPVRIPTPAKAAAIPPPSPRYGVEDEEEGEDEPAQITLAAFLEMTDTQFNDNFAVSERRQSLAYGLGAEEREYALSDFVDANVESVYVNTFKWMIDKMKIDIHEMGENVRAAEAMLSTNNPSIVRVYLSANEKDRPLFNQMLRGHRENAKLNARRDWFKDKYNTLDKIRPAIEHIHKEMTDDSDKYRVNLDGASKLLPDLRARHAELKAELERHRAEVQLIEECDKDELHELKHGPAGVVEQDDHIKRFTAELEGKKATLDDLKEQAGKLDAEVDAHRQAIEVAKAESSETSPTDVLRLDTELRALQDLHGWRLVRASPLVMVYNSELELSISTNGASLALASEPDALSTALLRITQLALAPLASSPVADLVRATGQLWTAVRHMRSELNTLALYYPVSYLDYEDGFAATATVVLPHFRAKAHLQFAIGPESLTAWPAPAAMAAVKVAAEVVYGKVDPARIQETAQNTLTDEVKGIFCQACAKVAELAP